MDKVTGLLAVLGVISTAVYGGTEFFGRVFNVGKEKVALVLGLASGVVAQGVGYLDLTGHGAWDWIAAGFFGLVGTGVAAVAHDKLINPAIKRSAGAVILGALICSSSSAQAADPCATPSGVTVVDQVRAELAADCAKAKAKAVNSGAPPMGEWLVPASVGHFADTNFIASGVGYQFKQSGVRVSLEAMIGRTSSFDVQGLALLESGCEVPGTIHVPSDDKSGLQFSIVFPLGK